ncbi:hypothetical protein K7X08_029255 [Anisodus acutangulus]|uniref:Uncharacterized protein n=1 Tax=Anisodus acutangulus TaxID=402998 RepID=A0A9Q1L405_9SOLA|nr:hypothetical protein K7X08_029255 [Anisodus acutangulus]
MTRDSWKKLDGAYFSRGGGQGNPVAFGNFIRPSSTYVDHKIICSTPKVFNWLQELRGTFPEFQQRLSNPQSCSTHYLDHINRGNLNKIHGFCNTLENSIKKNYYYHGAVAHQPEEVNLSLIIGRNNLKTSARTKTFNHIIDLEESDETPTVTKTGGQTKTWNHFIELEESNQTVSSAELKPKSPLGSARLSYSGYKCGYQWIHSFTNNIKDNWFDGTPINYFVSDGSMSCLEQNPLAEGVEQCKRPFLSGDISAKGKVRFSDERAFLDLNKSIFDDSFHSDDPSLACSSSRASSRESHGLAAATIIKESKQDPLSSPECKTQDSVNSGPGRSLSSCKSSCFEEISSGIETMQSGNQKVETLQANKSPCQEDVDSSNNSDNHMGETSEVDGQILRGAVSLVYFALEAENMEKPVFFRHF